MLAVALSVALVEVSRGATLTVQKDGSGDYTAIQPALDAAADGDTVLIGPGEYLEETSYRLPGWGFDTRSYGRVTSDNLTIIGAGVGQTVIGPTTYIPDAQHYNPRGFHYSDSGDLAIRELTIRNCREAVAVYGTVFMDRSELLGNYIGVAWETVGAGGWVKNTVIRGAAESDPFSVYIVGPGSDIQVSDCEFDDAEVLVKNIQDCRVKRCEVYGSAVGISIYGDSHVYVDSTSIAQISWVGVYFSSCCGICEITNSSVGGALDAIYAKLGCRFDISNTTLTGGSRSVLFASENPGPCVINNCDLIKGTGPVVRCENTSIPVTHDLTNNYWGTDQAADIRRWIIDINDDPAIKATVLYDPFSPTSVPVQKKSLGSVKSMFR